MGDQKATSDDIVIGFYEPRMRAQIIDLIVAEYGRDHAQQESLFDRFYDAPFQRNNAIRLVALDGERVCGFQSFFRWPYVLGGRELRTFQSGNSLVHPQYRGRRIFARLLEFLEATPDRLPIDFLMGFPVEMSFGSFIRNGWANPLDLSWYARPIRPLSILRVGRHAEEQWSFDRAPEQLSPVYPSDQFALSKASDFLEWRRGYRSTSPAYLYFHYREGGNTIRFELKPNRRGRIRELVIGDFVRDSADPRLLRNGLRALVRTARSHRFLTILSIAINDHSADRSLHRAIRRSGFLRLRPKIHFIVKAREEWREGTDPRRWWLLRSDIDTW